LEHVAAKHSLNGKRPISEWRDVTITKINVLLYHFRRLKDSTRFRQASRMLTEAQTKHLTKLVRNILGEFTYDGEATPAKAVPVLMDKTASDDDEVPDTSKLTKKKLKPKKVEAKPKEKLPTEAKDELPNKDRVAAKRLKLATHDSWQWVGGSPWNMSTAAPLIPPAKGGLKKFAKGYMKTKEKKKDKTKTKKKTKKKQAHGKKKPKRADIGPRAGYNEKLGNLRVVYATEKTYFTSQLPGCKPILVVCITVSQTEEHKDILMKLFQLAVAKNLTKVSESCLI
jgi:hypothetical protein